MWQAKPKWRLAFVQTNASVVEGCLVLFVISIYLCTGCYSVALIRPELVSSDTMNPTLGRSRNRRAARHDSRSQEADVNALYLGPGGQVVAVDQQGISGDALPDADTGPPTTPLPDVTSETYALDFQPSAGVVASAVASTTPPLPVLPATATSEAGALSTAASDASTSTGLLSLQSSMLSPTSTYSASSSMAVSSASPSTSVSSAISTMLAVSISVSSSSGSESWTSWSSSAIPTSSTVTTLDTTSATIMATSTTTNALSSTSSNPPPTGGALNAAAVASKHPVSFYLGVALASIVGFACIAAFIAWCFRKCAKRDENDYESTDPWPWDKDNRDHHLESGLQDPYALDEGRWPVHDMLAEPPTAPDSGYTHRDPFGIQYPNHAAVRDGAPRDSPRNQIMRAGAPLHPALHGTPCSVKTPFVPVHAAHQSVPDLAPDIGKLQVTNHMPGDVSSDEGSRANSRPGVSFLNPGATPMQVFNRDNGMMLNIPLTPMQPKPPMHSLATNKEAQLPLPGQTQRKASQGALSERSAGWAASIRSNLAHAIQAVVGNSNSTSSADELLPKKTEDLSASMSQDIGDSLSSPGRLAYDLSENPIVCLEPVQDSGHGDWDDLSAWMTNEKFTPKPPGSAALDKQLVAHPPLCRNTTSESIIGAEERRQNLQALRRSRKATKRSVKHRPALYGRMSSLSMCSEMSRASSTASGLLTKQEEYARIALRERRRRVLEMSGNGRCVGSRRIKGAMSPELSHAVAFDSSKT
ncbi:hypothetical protein BXZ70DRAFT_705771 [Cristinia sonorae]|uniref:Transmembrane protein n=1 Tax=Cristinia sonorae TaxID=1940300 RepID=A0A8K0XJS1_9AGAR|nr:hypothetical protein BXZ70DRAFT_705771 [Cristinia sonorae]